MTPDGQRLGPARRIVNDPGELAAQVASWGESPEVVLEATYGWYWAADVLAEAGARVHLAHPLGVKGFAYRRVENDLLTELSRWRGGSGRQVVVGGAKLAGRGGGRGG